MIATAPQADNTFSHPDFMQEPVQAITSALSERRLRLAFQPVVNATRTGFVAFHEALLRIETRDGRIIPAGEFIGAVEGSELGRVLDRHVLTLAIAALEGERRGRISINISACGVGDTAWLAILADACDRDPSIGDRLILEITETSELHLTSAALAFLYEVRRLGASIALDDFGSGHTSMRHLGKFRFDILKIDASYCQNIATDPAKTLRFRAIMRVARHFEMVTVAEGIEDPADAAVLAEAGADCLQGFHFGRPEIERTWRAA